MKHSEHVQNVKKYINENLTEEISLETLAELVHFSPYHFHRLFLMNTRETPMEYIRRLRLRLASRELLSVNSSIIEIATKYRFESQDGFCRAFKRYYGITPGDYRKLNIKNQPYDQKSFEEVKSIMYDISIYEKLACSQDEKREALGIIDKLLELSNKARQFGLLSLEPEIELVQPEFFKKAIQIIIDGIEPESARQILWNYVLQGSYKGKDLLIRIVIIEGILAIQQGVSTKLLQEQLASYLGEDFMEEINKYFGLDRETQLKKIKAFTERTENRNAFSKETSLLEAPFERMDNRSIQRLLRELDNATLIIAMSGASSKVQFKILNNVSLKLAALLIEDIESLNKPNIIEIAESQKRIIETLNLLRNQGDISY